MKTCPRCKAEVVVLVTNADTREQYCHLCATCEERTNRAVLVAEKIHNHTVSGTLDQYPLAERLKDLRGDWIQ
jgi:transcription elongation factor Elf1